MVPGPFQSTFLFSNPSLTELLYSSPEGGTTANSTYVMGLIEEANVDAACGPAVTGDRTNQVTVDGNTVLAALEPQFAEIIGGYKVKSAGISLRGSMLKHNVDGKGAYSGSYPQAGFLNWFNELNSG